MKFNVVSALVLILLNLPSWADEKIIPLAAFQDLAITGNFEVRIVAGQPKSELKVVGTRHQLANIHIAQQAGALSISQTACCQETVKPQLQLSASNFNSLRIKGRNQVSVSQLNSQDFSLYTTNQGDITLNGIVGLTNLVSQGSGTIAIYWLNSSELNLTSSGKIHVLLGGLATNLHAYIADSSSVNARFLKLDSAYARTQGCARLDVAATGLLNAQALGKSSVYFYKLPKMLNSYMFEAGAVVNVVGEPLVA